MYISDEVDGEAGTGATSGEPRATVDSAERRRAAVDNLSPSRRPLPPAPPHGQSSSLQRQPVQQQQQQQPRRHHDARAIVYDDACTSSSSSSSSIVVVVVLAGAIVYGEQDVFVVGPPGGLFQSTNDPDVSIYVPPSAVTQTITLTMQVMPTVIIIIIIIITTGTSQAERYSSSPVLTPWPHLVPMEMAKI